MQPLVRRTWAPRGQTPVLLCGNRHQRLAVISALSCSPQRRRLGLWFEICEHNLTAADCVSFVVGLLRHFRRGILLVLDRWQAHRCGVRELQRRWPGRIVVE